MDSLLAVSPLPFLSRRDLHSGRRGRGRRGNIALQCMKQFFSFSLSLCFLTGGHFQILLPPSDQRSLSSGSRGDPGCDSTSFVIYGERRFEFFVFFFSPPFLFEKEFLFVRAFIYGRIDLDPVEEIWGDRESRINTNAEEGGIRISSRYVGYFYR